MHGEAAVETTDDHAGAERLKLSEPIARVHEVPHWEALARMQGSITEGTLLGAGAGDFFALEDRNMVVAPWRRVFAVYDGNSFAVFDQLGRLIVEPTEGLVNGRQTKEKLVEEFSVEGFFYRPPKMRRSPNDRKRTAAERSQHGSSAFDTQTSSSDLQDRFDAAVESGMQTGTETEQIGSQPPQVEERSEAVNNDSVLTDEV